MLPIEDSFLTIDFIEFISYYRLYRINIDIQSGVSGFTDVPTQLSCYIFWSFAYSST
jgi:hypothetical protein